MRKYDMQPETDPRIGKGILVPYPYPRSDREGVAWTPAIIVGASNRWIDDGSLRRWVWEVRYESPAAAQRLLDATGNATDEVDEGLFCKHS